MNRRGLFKAVAAATSTYFLPVNKTIDYVPAMLSTNEYIITNRTLEYLKLKDAGLISSKTLLEKINA